MDSSRQDTQRETQRRDPYVMGFFALLAIALLLGVGLALKAFIDHEPAPETPAAGSNEGGLARLGAGLKQAARDMHDKIRAEVAEVSGAILRRSQLAKSTDAKAPAPAQAGSGLKSDPASTYAAIAAPAQGPHALPVPVNGTWTYKVFFGPSWNDAGQLSYRTRAGAANAPPESEMSWQPTNGQAHTWNFGTVAANHPSHGNTRFPGFFMHAAYLPETLATGTTLQWDFPWQGGNASLPQTERLRRYAFTVAGWERVKVVGGEFDAARLEGKLRYLEKDAVRAEVEYTLWYAPQARQVVRLRWMGRGPDEGSAQMIAELAAMRLP